MKQGVKRWNAVILEGLEKRGKNELVVASGLSPSGFVHIGTLRELAVAGLVNWGIKNAICKPSRFLLFMDDLDPLMSVPTGWDLPDSAVGKTLCSLSRHYPAFKGTWQQVVSDINKAAEIFGCDKVWMSDFYGQGSMDTTIETVLSSRQKISQRMKSEVSENSEWLPVVPIREDDTLVRSKGRFFKNRFITDEGKFELMGGKSKLPWRIDWPARWALFGVDFEPCGKDVYSSFESACWVSEHVFKYHPPLNTTYEFVLSPSGSKISKSKGNSSSLQDLLSYSSVTNLKHWLVNRPSSSLKLSRKALVRNYSNLVQDVVEYHQLPEDHRVFSELGYVFDGEVPTFTQNLKIGKVVQALLCMVGPRLPSWEEVNHWLPTAFAAQYPDFADDNKFKREMLADLYQYLMEEMSGHCLTVKDLSSSQVRSLVQLRNLLIENNNDAYVVNYIRKQGLGSLWYASVCASENGGPQFLHLLQSRGRSSLARDLTSCIDMGKCLVVDARVMKELLEN